MKIESGTGNTLYAFGGRIDTANSGKVTFLLDGVDINANDTDNIANWQREGEWADNWVFVGVIDTDGFFSAELRELRGKDFQQVLLFADDFKIGVASLRCDLNDNGVVDAGDLSQVTRMVSGNIADDLDCDTNNGGNGDGVITTADLVIVSRIVMGIIPAINN